MEIPEAKFYKSVESVFLELESVDFPEARYMGSLGGQYLWILLELDVWVFLEIDLWVFLELESMDGNSEAMFYRSVESAFLELESVDFPGARSMGSLGARIYGYFWS